MTKSNFSRREFLEMSAAAAGGSIGARTIFLKPESEPSRKKVAASDTVRFGIIGVGMEGSGLLGTSIQIPGVECAGAADLYDGRHTLAREIVRPDLAVTGEHELLERSPVLRTTIRLRNLYLDPLHLAQLALLVRRRETAGDEAVLDAVHHSINAIAAGLQSTG